VLRGRQPRWIFNFCYFLYLWLVWFSLFLFVVIFLFLFGVISLFFI
jgi:hypothetical protein